MSIRGKMLSGYASGNIHVLGIPFDENESLLKGPAKAPATIRAAMRTGTYPILRAYARHYAPLTILHLDAHPDLYDDFEGNHFSHACPFARIMEEQLAARLVQVGIRTMNAHQQQQAQRYGVEVIEMRHWSPDIQLALRGPIYLSLDLDVLDPACAPGVSHHEPGGFTTRELLRILQGVTVPVIGADIVELNPERDPQGITTMAAVKLLKEVLALMLAEQS